tara:strand:- start:104 stop:331 length:228 start_codon:yes stop_codon:yes gene_type:complete
VVDISDGTNFSISESMMYLRKVEEKLLDLKDRYFKDRCLAKQAIHFQDPFEGIRNYSQKIEANLIVMGSPRTLRL